MDRRRRGAKHTLTVSRSGAPLEVRTAEANASDHTRTIPLRLALPKVGGTPGRPKELPDEGHAGHGYDREATRWLLRWLGAEPHLGTRRTPPGSGRGNARRVVERAVSRHKGRRMRVRYDRLRVIRGASAALAAGVTRFRVLHDGVV